MRPESFDEDLMSDWSLWVLDHGLPPLPDNVEVGQSVPVARWAGPRFGAVMHVQWRWGFDDEPDELQNEIEVFARRENEWCASNGSGGGGWFDPPFKRPPTIGPSDARTNGEFSSTGDDWCCCAIDGLVGSEARYVEVDDADGTTRRPVESSFGAFVACSDGKRAAAVRVLSVDGLVLLQKQFGGDSED